MSSLTEPPFVTLTSGDLLASAAQTLVNTVNCVGIMGKGIALAFKQRYPDMFDDYVKRCSRGEVQLGRPYLYQADDHLIVNFPTKRHWRASSRFDDIVAGLDYLERHYREWGITSIAVPPLGCGNGQLEWEVIGPTLYRRLSGLGIPVELYAPHDPHRAAGPRVLADTAQHHATGSTGRGLAESWIAVIAALEQIQQQPHHWPIGRPAFQHLAYFATQAGISTGLTFQGSPHGPHAADLKQTIARLHNNGLITERQDGNTVEVCIGPTYQDVAEQFRDVLKSFEPAVDKTADLMSRMDTPTSEIAVYLHHIAITLHQQHGQPPTTARVMDAAAEWTRHRQPPVSHDSIIQALAVLALRGWTQVTLDDEFASLLDDLVTP
ncbi:macro domain-containing protein [Nonomuraea fuscirosea]|uniref:type II toxin-antitoxin system antitoxin DNA ADP-ribosyl glycohydrolase DarG n=1 Tax=Nonomuraea fuscirosea TaxID=1291556 RepID=UPI0034810C39